MENEDKVLAVRAYFFVPYNIMPIQHGIQAGHALGRFLLKYGRNDPQHPAWDFLENHETWVILNGGTTNERRDFDGISTGTLNQIADQLYENDIECAFFAEPDLNDALTAVCFLADERVFNRKDYPDFLDYILDVKMYPVAREEVPAQNYVMLKMQTSEWHQENFPEYYKEWVRFVGGVKNVFLRDLLKDKKKA
jgi:hypothetical protein